MNRRVSRLVAVGIASTVIGLGLALATIFMPTTLSGQEPQRSELFTNTDRTYVWLNLRWWDQTVTMVDDTITLPNEGFESRFWIDGRRFVTPDRRFRLPTETPPQWLGDSMQFVKAQRYCDIVAVGWPWRCARYLRAPFPSPNTPIGANLGTRLEPTNVMPSLMWFPLIGNVAAFSAAFFGIIVVVPKALLLVRPRRNGHCRSCGYPQVPQSTECPECGTLTNAA